MKSEHSKSEKKWNALLNWIFPFYACEMLEILKGIAYTCLLYTSDAADE